MINNGTEGVTVEKLQVLPAININRERTWPRALLIEDNDFVRMSESLLLREAGFQIVSADNGEQGLEAYTSNKDEIDLVVTRYTLPKCTGDEICVAINDTSPHVPVILVCGETSTLPPQTKEHFDAIFVRPVDGRQFIETATSLVM